MHTFADLAKVLNRHTVYVSGLQSRFELPAFDGAGYSEAYLNRYSPPLWYVLTPFLT